MSSTHFLQSLNGRCGGCLAVVLVASLSLALLGCNPRPKEVPSGSKRYASGNEGVVSMTTPEDGTVYVYDRSDGKLMYSGRVDPSKLVAVDIDRDQITVDGTPVQTNTLHRHHRYEIFFEPGGR